jgi:hypothetical protein
MDAHHRQDARGATIQPALPRAIGSPHARVASSILEHQQ